VAKECTVLIGISWNGKPIAGVVNQPFYEATAFKDAHSYFNGRVFWGIVGLGLYDLSRGRLAKPANETGKVRVITSRFHVDNQIISDIMAIPNAQLLQAGGAGYKTLTVIDGTSDCYLYPKDGCKRWDTCAPEALIRSLNGCLTDVFDKEYSYENRPEDFLENCYGVVASLDENNSKWIKYVSEEVKSSVLSDVEKLKEKKKNSS
jgi:3'(2'), 5'-bisphosphate nucleotidase